MGCGEGHYARFLGELGVKSHYLGVDIVSAQRWQVIRCEKNLTTEFRLADATRLDYQAEFDLVLSIASLEHIPAHEQALVSAVRALLPDGLLVVFVPGVSTWFWEMGSHGWVDAEGKQHGHYYTSANLRSLLGKNFDVLSIRAVGLLSQAIIGWKDAIVLGPAYVLMRLRRLLGYNTAYWTKEYKYALRCRTVNRFLRVAALRRLYNAAISLIVRLDQRVPVTPYLLVACCRKRIEGMNGRLMERQECELYGGR